MMTGYILSKQTPFTLMFWPLMCLAFSTFHSVASPGANSWGGGFLLRAQHSNLIGGIPIPLKNMSSSVGITIPNICKSETCSKPPTRNSIKELQSLEFGLSFANQPQLTAEVSKLDIHPAQESCRKHNFRHWRGQVHFFSGC